MVVFSSIMGVVYGKYPLARCPPSQVSLSYGCSPHELTPQGFGEGVRTQTDHSQRVRSSFEQDGGIAGQRSGSSVEHQEVIPIARIHFEADRRIVRNDQRTHIQRVGGDGRKDEVPTGRHDDRPVPAQRVGCGAGGRGHYEAVGIVSRQIVVVEVGIHPNHRTGFTLEYGCFVQGVGGRGAVVFGHFQQGTGLDGEVAVQQACDQLRSLVAIDIGEEAQSAGIYAQDRDLRNADLMRRAQECTVTAHTDHVVDMLGQGVYHSANGRMEVQILLKKGEEFALYIKRCAGFFQLQDQSLDGSSLFALVTAAEYGYFLHESLSLLVGISK